MRCAELVHLFRCANSTSVCAVSGGGGRTFHEYTGQPTQKPSPPWAHPGPQRSIHSMIMTSTDFIRSTTPQFNHSPRAGTEIKGAATVLWMDELLHHCSDALKCSFPCKYQQTLWCQPWFQTGSKWISCIHSRKALGQPPK